MGKKAVPALINTLNSESVQINPTTIGRLPRTPTEMYHADEGGDLSLGQSFAVEFMATHRIIRPTSLLLSPTSEYLFDEQNCHSFGNLPANEDQGLK
jgi:hypothetical protein